jgi:hypothetical protein
MATLEGRIPPAFVAHVKAVLLGIGGPGIEIQPEALARLYVAFTSYGEAVLRDAATVQQVVTRTGSRHLDPKQIRLAARLHGSPAHV